MNALWLKVLGARLPRLDPRGVTVRAIANPGSVEGPGFFCVPSAAHNIVVERENAS